MLLDTHALVWWYLKPDRLGDEVRREIADNANAVSISAVSGFEIALKHWLGKMPEAGPLIANFRPWASRERFSLLNITLEHALAAARQSGCERSDNQDENR
ncbi:type II toxin-antitoxin system VapC family toxin, partial [uncultured Sphingomonas sp.]|uniref:type II toxin-antitoxin system VapC family toxin n=1 Tax=uncultured Sphingomonas sp. TaxID=158754 RepID=UPI0035CB6018